MTESQNTPAPDPSTNPETAATGSTPPVPPSADAASGRATPTEEGATGGADPTAAVTASTSGTTGETDPATGGATGLGAASADAPPPVDPDVTLESGMPSSGTGTAGAPTDGPAATPPLDPASSGATPTDASAASADAAGTGTASFDASAAPADAAAAGTTPTDTSATPSDAAAAGTTPTDASAAPVDAAAAGVTPTDASAAPVDAAGTAPADASATPADAGTAGTHAEDGPGHGHMPRTLPADPPGGALKSDRIQLVSDSGQAMALGVRTPLGKHMVRQFGEDSNVWDTEQCTIERGPDGAWQIVPVAGTTNETLVNGQAITGPQPLHDGDVIAVGRAEKGIVKLPLTARAV